MTIRVVPAPSFEPKVALDLAMEFLKHDGQGEVSCACMFDPERQMFTDWRVLFRGNATRTTCLRSDFKPGECLVHNHPSGSLWPSEQDLAAAEFLAMKGIGFAICDNFCERVYVVREPDPPPTPKPPAPPALPPAPPTWSLSVGRWQLLKVTRS